MAKRTIRVELGGAFGLSPVARLNACNQRRRPDLQDFAQPEQHLNRWGFLVQLEKADIISGYASPGRQFFLRQLGPEAFLS
jgi:hypothetical protein